MNKSFNLMQKRYKKINNNLFEKENILEEIN